MTEITDQDRHAARVWAKNWQGDQDGDTSAAARVILATVDAPEPTLAERLKYRAALLDNGDPDGDTPQALRDLATRAAQMEHDLMEARAEVERLTTERDRRLQHEPYRRGQAIPSTGDTFIVPCTERQDRNAETPNPAYVNPGEAWIVEVNGERRNAVKDRDPHFPWNTVGANSRFYDKDNKDITLVSRLVPAPRVITNTDDLEALSHCTVIRDSDGDMFQRIAHGWYKAGYETVHRSDDNYVCLPVTVLWEPEA